MNGRDLPRHTSSLDAATVIVGILKLPVQIAELEKSTSDVLQGVDAHANELIDMHREIAAIEAKIDRVATGIEALYERQQCSEVAAEQQRLLSAQHYDEQVIEPLARRVFPLIDLLGDCRARAPHKELMLEIDPVLDAARTELLMLLEGYGIEALNCEPGMPMDARFMCPTRIRRTADPDLDMTIAKSLRVGFQRGERVLRPQSVEVFRMEPKAQNVTEQGDER